MEETTLEYSLLKIDGKENRKDSVRSVKGSGRISVQRSTLYVIIISVSVSFVGSEILWYLMYNRNNNCNVVIPEGYELTARRNNSSGTTLPHTVQEMTKTFHTGTVNKLKTKQSGQEGTDIKGATNVSTKQTTTGYSGCPTNWLTYGQSCYYFSNESVRWLEATIRCQQLGGYLAEINTATENQFLRRYAKQIDDIDFDDKIEEGIVPETDIKTDGYESLQKTKDCELHQPIQKSKTNQDVGTNVISRKKIIYILLIFLSATVIGLIGVIILFASSTKTDGNWESWQMWSNCSTDCGDGFRTRSRTCSNPKPSHSGRYCQGKSIDKESCGNENCSCGAVPNITNGEYVLTSAVVACDYGYTAWSL